MESNWRERIESLFESLAPEAKTAIIIHGIALYQSTLKKRLFLAQAKVKQLEDKYRTTLSQLDNKGLPEDANYEMHEDYIMWHHWTATVEKLTEQITLLDTIAENRLNVDEAFYVSY